MENCTFKLNYGHRVDTQSHNFVVFRNWINLSFSYMTFVIKDFVDTHGYLNDDYSFDLEGNDFILERSSIFTSGDLVKHNYEKLAYILKNYLQNDVLLLESLHYQKPAISDDKIEEYDFQTNPDKIQM